MYIKVVSVALSVTGVGLQEQKDRDLEPPWEVFQIVVDQRNQAIETIKALYQLLDNVDTAGDVAKSDDKAYRSIAQ